MTKLVIPLACVTIISAACASIETTASVGVDTEANTYEFAVGYNKEDSFNVLAFGNAGFLLREPNIPVVSSGLEYEHYFNDTIGVSGKAGLRYYGNTSSAGILLQLGVPFSWSYGKITPYIGGIIDGKPRFNTGVSLTLRNQGVSMLFITLLAIKNAAYDDEDDDAEEDEDNWKAAGLLARIVGMLPVEDKLPYPAWKFRKYADKYDPQSVEVMRDSSR